MHWDGQPLNQLILAPAEKLLSNHSSCPPACDGFMVCQRFANLCVHQNHKWLPLSLLPQVPTDFVGLSRPEDLHFQQILCDADAAGSRNSLGLENSYVYFKTQIVSHQNAKYPLCHHNPVGTHSLPPGITCPVLCVSFPSGIFL